jgi:3-phosphoshikimate 1-carboxyvinyltransferase
LPWTGKPARIEVEGDLVSRPYVELTLGLMARFGVVARREDWKAFEIPAGDGYASPGALEVEGDASSASYFLAAGALGGGPVRVEGVGRSSVQGDVEFARVVEAMGARVLWGDTWIESSGKSPDSGGASRPSLIPFDLDFNLIPDAAMTAAVMALFASGPSRLRNIGSWRVKETDRLSAMAAELRKLGATVEEGADYLRITPPPALRPATIATYDDHRMAMSFSLAALGGVTVRITDPGCVAKTFPEYFEVFAALAEQRN